MCKDLEGEQNIRNLAFFIPFNLPVYFFQPNLLFLPYTCATKGSGLEDSATLHTLRCFVKKKKGRRLKTRKKQRNKHPQIYGSLLGLLTCENHSSLLEKTKCLPSIKQIVANPDCLSTEPLKYAHIQALHLHQNLWRCAQALDLPTPQFSFNFSGSSNVQTGLRTSLWAIVCSILCEKDLKEQIF